MSELTKEEMKEYHDAVRSRIIDIHVVQRGIASLRWSDKCKLCKKYIDEKQYCEGCPARKIHGPGHKGKESALCKEWVDKIKVLWNHADEIKKWLAEHIPDDIKKETREMDK